MGKKAGLAVGVGLGAGLAAGAAGKGLFDLGARFDAEFDKIRIGSGRTGAALDVLEEDFKAVLKDVPSGFDSVGTAISELVQRIPGISGPPLRRLAKQLVQLSEITGTDVGQNVAAVTRLFGDWSIKTEQQAGQLDKLFRVSQKTGIGVNDLAVLMTKFGSPLRSLGFSFEEAAAMFGRFEREGVNIQTTLPGFRQALKNMARPTDDLAAKFKELGISTEDPAKGLEGIFEAIKRLPDNAGKSLAFDVFGARAAVDMQRAIKEGRFEFDELIDSMNKGSDTINKAEKDTRDFAEQWALLKNRVFVGLEPLANKVFDTIGDGMERLATADFDKITADIGIDFGTVDLGSTGEDLNKLKGSALAFGKAMNDVFGPIIRTLLPGLAQGFKGSLQVVGGVLKTFAALLRGDFSGAWDGVELIFKGALNTLVGTVKAATAPFRVAVKALGGVLAEPFKGAWSAIKTIFTKGIGAVGAVLRGAKDGIRAAARALGRGVIDGFDNLKRLPGIVGNFVGKVPEAVRGVIGRAAAAGLSVGKAILRGIGNAFKSAGGFVADIGTALRNWVNDNTLFGDKISVGKGPIKVSFNIPKLAKGGTVNEALTLVGEEGPELAKYAGKQTLIGRAGPEVLNLPIGTRVYSHPETKRKLAPVIQKVSRVLDGKSLPGVEGVKQSQGRALSKPLGARTLSRVAERLGIPGFAKGGKVKKDRKDTRSKAREIWEEARQFLPGADAAMPKLRFPKHIPRDYAGFVDSETNRVSLSKGAAKGIRRGWDYYENLLIHEWAHVFQARAAMKKWEMEGGAEAFARRISPKVYGRLGLPYSNKNTSAYPGFTARVNKEKPEDWILREQFAAARTGPESAKGTGASNKDGGVARAPGTGDSSAARDKQAARRRHYDRIRDAIFRKWREIETSKPPRDYDLGDFMWQGLAIAPSNVLSEKLGWQKGKKPGSTNKVRKPPTWIPKGFWPIWNKGESWNRPYGRGGPDDHKNVGRASSSLQPAARYLASTMKEKFGLSVSSGVRPGDSGSFHSVGKAVDLVGTKMREGAEWVKTSGLYKTLLEGIHNPNLSTDSGKMVSSGFWGKQTWEEHKDHVHLAADSIRQTVKRNLDEKGGSKKTKRITGGSLSLGQMVTLSKKVGFPDPALAAAIGYAESRGKVGAVGDGGDSLGLFQINTPAHPKYDKDKLQHDAFYNARAAFDISKKGKNFQPWTQFRNGAYKAFKNAKGKPLPKGTTKGTPTGSKFTDYLAMKLYDAESDTPSDPKDDIRWINRALRYWRGVRKRNKAVGNWAKADEAKHNIVDLRDKKTALRKDLEDENLFTLGELTEIGTGPNAFKIGGMQTTLDNISLEKANASLTFPPDTDDSIGALKVSLQDDIAASNRLVGFWQGLKTLTDGFFRPAMTTGRWEGEGAAAHWVADQGSGPFKPTKAQSRQLAKTKNQPERIALLNRFQAEEKAKPPKGTWIQGTIAQKIEATNELGSAKSQLRDLLAEINKTDETEAITGANAKTEQRAFLASLGDLFKNFGPNFKPLQSFGDGGIIQGPKGRKVVIEGHGGEAVINEDGNLTVTIDPKQLERMIQQPQDIKNVAITNNFPTATKDPHIWSRNLLHEVEVA